MRRLSTTLLLLFSIHTILLTSQTQRTWALSVDNSCTKIETIFARGSGQSINQGEASKFFDSLESRIKDSGLTRATYELGTEKYGDHQYPAVDVGNFWNGNALGAATSAGYGNDYGNSVRQGVGELATYLIERSNKCRSVGTYFILGGYSQGAQVVGQTLEYLPSDIKNRIAYVGLFGDPKLYYPEGEGGTIFSDPPACDGKTRSPYRRSFSHTDCRHSAGSLGPRKPYLPDDMMHKTDLWCYDHDFVCGTSPYFWDTSGHMTYRVDGKAIDKAAQRAAEKLKALLPSGQIQQINDLPLPSGTGAVGEDLVFIVDFQESMDSQRQRVAQKIRDIVSKLDLSYSGPLGMPKDRYAVVGYHGDPNIFINGQYEPLAAVLTFYDSHIVKSNWVDNLEPTPLPGSPLYAMKSAFNALDWRQGATKSVILFTNAQTYPDPDLLGTTLQYVAKRALEIDPINVYPVVPDAVKSIYGSLADKTSGQVVAYSNGNFDLETAADTAFAKIAQRPIPHLESSEYTANPGQTITFDASDSYAIGSMITKYEWDFDGDNVFDATTTNPTIDHIYSQTFNGLMQVRVSAANGTVANLSATVKITPYVAPPPLPKTPQNLKATVLETNDNKSTVRLTWDQTNDSQTTFLALRANGIMLGIMTPDRTSIDITDVDHTIDTDFSIAGVANSMAFGNPAVVTLDGPEFNFPKLLSNNTTTNGVVVATTTANNNGTPASLTSSATYSDGEKDSLITEGQSYTTTRTSNAILQSLLGNSKSTGFSWLSLSLATILSGGATWHISKHIRKRRIRKTD